MGKINILKRSSKRKKIKRIKFSVLTLLFLIIFGGLAVITPLYRSYAESYTEIDIVTREEEYSMPELPEGVITEKDTVNEDSQIKETGKEVENGIYYKKQKDPDIENILIIGSDSRNFSVSRGRSDTMIIASFNLKNGEVKLISLLRDMLVPIEGYDWNRLNSAYAFGGVSLCVNTINEVFDLDIQKFIVIDFAGAKTFIDKCGGVSLSLSNDELTYLTEGGYKPKKENDGLYRLTGEMALSHMRNRKVGNDFTRTARQRQVILSIYNQVLKTKNPAEIYSLIKEGFKLIKTNIKLDKMLKIAKELIGFKENLKTEAFCLPIEGSYKNAVYDKKSVLCIEIEDNRKYLNKNIYGNEK